MLRIHYWLLGHAVLVAGAAYSPARRNSDSSERQSADSNDSSVAKVESPTRLSSPRSPLTVNMNREFLTSLNKCSDLKVSACKTLGWSGKIQNWKRKKQKRVSRWRLESGVGMFACRKAVSGCVVRSGYWQVATHNL